MRSLAQGEHKHQQQQHLATNNLQFPRYLAANKVPGYSAGIRHDLSPFTLQQTPFVLHKHSSYYNQDHTHQCKWSHCRMRFLSSKDLLTPVQDQHLSYLHVPASIKYWHVTGIWMERLSEQWAQLHRKIQVVNAHKNSTHTEVWFPFFILE